MQPLITERQIIRPFRLEDAGFILRLLNEPSFIENIADKGVRSLEQAEDYLRQGPLASYEKFGHGLWLVQHRESGIPMGMCGLIKRDLLPEVDLGYAYVPEWCGQGFAREAAAACLAYGRDVLRLAALMAIVSPGNLRSIHLLAMLGFQPQGHMAFEPGDEVAVYRIAFEPTALQ